MLATTSYSTLDLDGLLSQYEGLVNTLNANYREYASITTSFNRDYLAAYARSPGNSVVAKEREADFNCQELKNDLTMLEYDIKALEASIEMVRVMSFIRGGIGGFTPHA
jgi:hypothetical protein